MSAATTGLRDAAAILGALSTTSAVELHAHTLKLGFLPSYLHLCSSFLKSYAASGRLASARQLFDETPHRDIPLWNTLVSAYARSRQPEHALLASSAMVRAGSRPNNLSVTSLLSACAQLRSLVHGRELHGYAVRNIPILDLRVLNVLVSMYGRCGRLAEVDTVFAIMGDTKNVVSWTCMINAFCENGRPAEALEVFNEMRLAVVKIDEVTLLAVISACTKLDRTSELGEWVEEYACENGFLENTPRVANALIHMHGKMGRVKRSCEIFDSMSVRTVVSWTAMIQALAVHGHGMAALVRFSQMLRQGFWPDEVIFLSVINSCGHSRLVSEGRQLFKSMVEEYQITPWMEHYGSMVDLLCRSGMLDEAFEFVLAMPVKPDPVIWRVLTGACRDHGNTSLARKVIDHVIDVEPDHGGNYVLASNLYAAGENWGRVVDVRVEMGVRKETSRCSTAGSYIEVNCEKTQKASLLRSTSNFPNSTTMRYA